MHKLLCGALFLFSLPAMATIMVAPPSGASTTVFALPGENVWNTAQSLILGQFTITGTPGLTYGSGTYPVGNYVWSPDRQFGYITPHLTGYTSLINLGGTYSSVGGFFAYEDRWSQVFVEALDSAMNLLDQKYDLVASAGGIYVNANDGGAFRGIDAGTESIHYLRITGPVLMHSITLSEGTLDAPAGNPSDVPEPLLLGCVLLSLCAFVLKRQRTPAGDRVVSAPRSRPRPNGA
jgi:hypothetical protein